MNTESSVPRRHRTDIQVRFADTDAMGHLNNASYALYAETGRLDFFRAIGAALTSLILARLAIDFRRQVNYGEPVHVETWVERMGRSSISVAHTIVAAGQVVAEVSSVVVHFDYASSRAQDIPADLRDRLSAYVIGGTG